jgi:hypothetical protein
MMGSPTPHAECLTLRRESSLSKTQNLMLTNALLLKHFSAGNNFEGLEIIKQIILMLFRYLGLSVKKRFLHLPLQSPVPLT